jgi:hypothetical protein
VKCFSFLGGKPIIQISYQFKQLKHCKPFKPHNLKMILNFLLGLRLFSVAALMIDYFCAAIVTKIFTKIIIQRAFGHVFYFLLLWIANI